MGRVDDSVAGATRGGSALGDRLDARRMAIATLCARRTTRREDECEEDRERLGNLRNETPILIHKIGSGAKEKDRPFESPLTGYYRWFEK